MPEQASESAPPEKTLATELRQRHLKLVEGAFSIFQDLLDVVEERPISRLFLPSGSV
jgi:hypothetical protein